MTTNDEIKTLEKRHDLRRTLRLTKSVADLTAEETTIVAGMLAARLAKAQKDYDQAVQFRPSYAPAGRATREEQGTLAVLHQEQELSRLFELTKKS